jgi:hypothetical protein
MHQKLGFYLLYKIGIFKSKTSEILQQTLEFLSQKPAKFCTWKSQPIKETSLQCKSPKLQSTKNLQQQHLPELQYFYGQIRLNSKIV